MAPPILHFDYESSPYARKTKWILNAAGVDFKRVDQPRVLPRPDLEAMGITYRRIPVLAVGKDVYCDSSLIISIVLDLSGSKLKRGGASDKAWEAWGAETFQAVVTLVPGPALSEVFVKDRKTVFPILNRKDFKELRPSGLADLRSRLAFLESEFLGNSSGPFSNGKEPSLADLHVVWPIYWALKALGAGQEPGLGKDDFPKVWAMIDALPEVKADTVSADDAKKTILGSEFLSSKMEVEKNDPLASETGKKVTVESLDAEPGAHPQVGKLVGLTKRELVLELDNGIRLHFPKEGYVVKAA
ncbi:uncharacterized protein LTR77_010048 [Saxophila tyrrhenica]|uniref:GST N-terminal domain-containing protein n=1 Tax=Saxophila tyrrhenica TaxID=1690608 RepID=A0AAV9NWS1_9PEZI|nr:hypothetical protein LTR77_010048 [Saxophila tyrrhenica]